MSDRVFDQMHEELFDTFAVDGRMARAGQADVPVRVVVDEGVERLGEYGQVIGVVTVVSFLSREFRPRQNDMLTVFDEAGAEQWSKRVQSVDADDRFIVKAVIRG